MKTKSNKPVMSKKIRRIRVSAITFGACLFLTIHCAHQVPPTGGPDDRILPAIVAAVPAKGTCNHPRREPVQITFGEWIEKRDVTRMVTVFPIPEGGYKVDVNGRTLSIAPATAFAESTTYHVEVSSGIRDLHGNALGTAYGLMFSTGKTLDSGRISGGISLPVKPSGFPVVALYRLRTAIAPDTMFMAMPDYLTQSDSGGEFTFENIRPGRYGCIAFSDVNIDHRLQPGREQVWAADSLFIGLEREAGPLFLYEVKCDSATAMVASISTQSKNILAGTWSATGWRKALPFDSLWRIETLDSISKPVAIASYTVIPNSRRFFLRLSKPMQFAGYRLIYPRISPVNDSLKFDTLRFNGTALSDTSRPRLLSRAPLRTTGDLTPVIKLVFSEPVRTIAPVCSLWDTTARQSIVCRLDTVVSDTIYGRYTGRLVPGHAYSLRLKNRQFVDLGGNTPKDTNPIKLDFTTPDESEFCISLSGRDTCSTKTDNRIWVASTPGLDKKYMVADSGGRFLFSYLLAGKVILGWFMDRNGDGQESMGSLFPWVASEPAGMFKDTVEARKNWDVEGVDVCGEQKSLQNPATKPMAGK